MGRNGISHPRTLEGKSGKLFLVHQLLVNVVLSLKIDESVLTVAINLSILSLAATSLFQVSHSPLALFNSQIAILWVVQGPQDMGVPSESSGRGARVLRIDLLNRDVGLIDQGASAPEV